MLKHKIVFLSLFTGLVMLFTSSGASAQSSPRKFMQGVLSQPGVAESFTPGCLGKKYPAYKDRAAWEKLLGEEEAARIIATGENYLDYEWKYIPASSYLEFNKSGNRTIMENPYSENRSALARLLLAELAEGKGRFIPKIADGMYYFAFMPAWIIAAHIVRQPGGSSLPSGDYHFIDLFDGESCSVISWCLYFMKEEVDKIDPFICRATRRALNDNIINPFLDPDKEPQQWWMGFRGEGVNNWNPWCNYNVIQAFLLVEEDQAKINEAVARSVRSVDIYIDQFPDDGACDEGPSYFTVAAGIMFRWMQEMYDASGGKFNPFDNDKIRRMGEYESRADMGGGFMANFADARAKMNPGGLSLWNYGKAMGSPELVNYGLYCMRNGKDGFNIPTAAGSGNAGGGLETIWNRALMAKEIEALNERCKKEGYENVVASLRKDVPSNTWYDQTEVAFMHTSDWSIAAKAGHNGESHNHNDIGSFILSAGGHPVLIDVGQPTYTRQTFSSERYQIFAMQSGWHNAPVINGFEQKEGKQYKASDISFSSKGSASTLSMDLKGAYLPDASCNSWKRSINVSEGKKGSVMTITDTYSLSKRLGADEEHFITAGDVFIPGDVFDGQTIAEGMVLIHDGNTVLQIAYPKTLSVTVEEKPLDDRNITTVWGDQISRIMLKSSANAPLKGSYKITITQR